MTKSLIHFISNLLLFTLILAGLGFLYSYLAPDKSVTPAWPYIIIFFFVITLLVYYLVKNYLAKKISRFVNFYMILTFLKLFLFIIIIVIYAIYNRVDAIPFIITFLIYYLLFTVFEVISVLKASQKAANSNSRK